MKKGNRRRISLGVGYIGSGNKTSTYSRKAKEAFDKIKSIYDNQLKNLKKGTYQKVLFTKKATPEQLKKIKEKAIKEDRIILIKKIVSITLFLIIAIYVIGFVKF